MLAFVFLPCVSLFRRRTLILKTVPGLDSEAFSDGSPGSDVSPGELSFWGVSLKGERVKNCLLETTICESASLLR
jgi:hypothetical protein